MSNVFSKDISKIWYSAVTSVVLETSVNFYEALSYAELTHDSSATLPSAPDLGKMRKLWSYITEKTGNDAIGLKLIPHLMKSDFSALSAAVRASKNVGDALLRFERYHAVISSALNFSVNHERDAVEIIINPSVNSPIIAQPPKDAAFGLIVEQIRAITGGDIRPVRLEMIREEPQNTADFEKFFHCPIHYSSDRNAIIFKPSILSAPLINPNPELAEHIDLFLRNIVAEKTDQTYSQKVYNEIAALLPMGAPTIELVAENFHITSRTLQRRLSNEQATFKDLLTQVRFDMARHYLADGKYSIGEVGYLLGFGSHSNFVRFFRKQTGVVPSEYSP